MEPIPGQVNDRVKKLNLYELPQYAWLVLLYYLMLNALLNFSQTEYCKIIFDIKLDFISSFPSTVVQLNETIKEKIAIWMPFIRFLWIGFFISGLLLTIVRRLPIVRNYGVIQWHADYGLFIFPWLALSDLTYYLYMHLGSLFILIPPLFYLCADFLERVRKKLESKGITLGR